MDVWIIAGAVAWTVAIWITASFVGTRMFGGLPKRKLAGGGSLQPVESSTPGPDAGPFMAYPTDYLFAVVDVPAEADDAVADLRSNGIDEEAVSTFTGEAGAIRIDARGSRHGLFGRLVRFAQAMSMDADQAARYEDEARNGHTVIAIHASDPEIRARAHAVLKAHGAHYINYYARLHFETLDP